MDEAARARASMRSEWKGEILSLDHSEDQDLSDLSVATRLAELLRLSLAAFALSGLPCPSYERSTMPGRCCTLADDA